MTVKKTYCNEQYVHTMVFDFSEDSLQDLMLNRKKAMTTGANSLQKRTIGSFTEHEAWSVLSQIMQGLTQLYDLKVFYGDVQPNNIMVVDKQSMRVKLFDPKYCLAEKTAYKRKLHEDEYQTPLCPYGLKELMNKNIHPRMAPEKAEVFAVGITMISMLFCEDFNNYYDYRSFTVDFEQLGSKLGKLQAAGYSKELLGLIETALIDEEFKRPNIQRFSQLVLTCPKNTYVTQGAAASNNQTSNTTADISRQSAGIYVLIVLSRTII